MPDFGKDKLFREGKNMKSLEYIKIFFYMINQIKDLNMLMRMIYHFIKEKIGKF